MDFEDYLEPEVAVTAVVAATVFSPRARHLIRQGAVYSTAGVLAAGETLGTFFRGFGQGFKQANEEHTLTNTAPSSQTQEGSATNRAGGQER